MIVKAPSKFSVKAGRAIKGSKYFEWVGDSEKEARYTEPIVLEFN